MKMKMVKAGFAGAALCLFAAGAARGEAILQVFNQSHNEIAARLPEIAEAGYTALWVPPPTKANGGMSVGYDLNDPFDIGNTDLRGTWSTRYGVEADLHNLIELCHRFGMRVYFDNVMNHRSYDVPGWDERTATDVYPGMCPEDFHVRTTSDGFYRKWDNVRDWNDEWQVMFLGLSDLLDIAHETPNQNFGAKEGDWHEKPQFVRHPNNPEFYDRKPNGDWVGFGPDNGITVEDLRDHPDFYKEDVGAYLIRAVRWLVDRTKVDGLRLDAVKHVPYYFFGAQDDSASSDGYVGNVQWQFNMTRGFNDWENHRESVFNSDDPRNDAMLFGEHLGNPPPQWPYVSAGMRLVDDRLRNELNWRFSANQLDGFDGESAGSELGPNCGVMHAQSHDNDFVDRKPLHHAMYFMRRGLGLVYSDGNCHAETLTGSGGAFPRWAQTDFLGQWHQKQIPTLLHAHENFARYNQIPKWSQGNYIAFQRGGDGGWASMLFMLNSGWDWYEPTKTAGDFYWRNDETGEEHDSYLYDYASDMYMPYYVGEGDQPQADYAWGHDLAWGRVKIPNNSYAIWSYKNPDPSGLYPTPYPECFANGDDRVIAPDSRVITVMEDGQVVEPVWVTRKDGVDGDPDFNPYGVADTNDTDYAYRIALPRVTKGTNVTLAVKADGSAETMLLRLDGGMDFGNHDPDDEGGHGWGHYYEKQSWDTDKVDRPDWRDYPPGSAHDFFLGFEDGGDYFTRRMWPEKFAAADTKYCKVGTGDATTYQKIIGGASTNLQPKTAYNEGEPETYEQLAWVYHNPEANTDAESGAASASRAKAPAKAASANAPAEKAPQAESASAEGETGAAERGAARASATWVGKSYIFANGWYKGDGEESGHWEPVPGPFDGAWLGDVSGTIAFGGQCRTYGETNSEDNPARICYNIVADGGDIVGHGTCTLYWYDYADNDNWFESRTGVQGEWKTTDIDVGGLDAGTYSLEVWFEANGADGTTIYGKNGDSNYAATFRVGGGDDPEPEPGDTRAAWIGKSYVNVNGTWYTGTGRRAGDPDAWWPEAGSFGGHDLGCLTSLELGGQAQTYGESDGEGHPARMNYRISAYGSAPASGTLPLAWYQATNNNHYYQSGGSSWSAAAVGLDGLTPGETYTLDVSFEAEGADGWFAEKKKIRGATFTYAAAPAAGVEPQFRATAAGIVIWAKTPKKDGISAFLYYTADGEHWPEGAGGIPANPYTRVAAGRWSHTGKEGNTDWWHFVLPAMKDGTVLRYKIGAARVQHGEEGSQTPYTTIWPDGPDAITCKKQMMSLWTVPGLDFTTQEYHKHNDYKSWTRGFKDGWHLATARMLLRTDKHPREIANTFRQTFYLDLHTPDGYFLYPGAGETDPFNGKSEYGLVVKTDNTVDEVWYHITDHDDDNDGPGNGTTSNGVEWARAAQISPWTKEMAQDTEHTKIWRFAYSRIPGGGQKATVRVRLREVSSVPADEWDKAKPEEGEALEALHVTELKLEAPESGPQEKFYILWPAEDGTMVEAGWRVQMRYTSRMASGLTDEQLREHFKVYVNSTSNGSTNKGTAYAMSGLAMTNEWHWEEGNGLNELSFSMPNAYNGIDGWRYALTVEFDNQNDFGEFHKSAQRMVTHKGPLLPKCIVTTPPETDSDGAPWTITMEDSVEAAVPTNRALRETPIIVLTDQEATSLDISFVSPTNYAASIAARAGAAFPSNDVLRLIGVETAGTDKVWTFAWQVTNAGTYRFEAKVEVPESTKFSAPTNGAFRTTHVRFRQKVKASAADDTDWDDDGVPNAAEAQQASLPDRKPEQWVQDEVFVHKGSGEFDSGCPDTDGDGLPDGLELGYRQPAKDTNGVVRTDTAVDTNGDGWPNFIGDLDPPFYNTLPDNHGRFDPGVVSDAGSGADRTKQIAGSVTDPRNPDTDGDGLPDGVEDANRNGWTDGDGQPFPTDWDPYRGFNWADGKMKKETWEETSPCVWDSDADGLCDGYGEDSDFDGRTAIGVRTNQASSNVVMFTAADYREFGVDAHSTANSASTRDPKPYTSRAIDWNKLFAAYNVTDPNGNGSKQTGGWPRLVVLETDPLCADTDHDGLPDGWEANHSLDPLNNGVYDFRTGLFTDDPTHGAKGNPDGDVYDNATEYGRGSNPRSWDSDGTGGGVEPGAFTVGPGEKLGKVNDTEFFTEFTWWTLDDLMALDDYNQGGNSSDIYRCGDGFDSSRDMVAFYFRDGGAEDGKLYFRVDFDDLRPFAEESSLNIYVAINYGSYGNGLEALPDDVNCDTEMGWNALTGVYDSQSGCTYRQEKDEEGKFKPSYESLPGFNGAYFNSELDSVMWSVDRAALLGDDWQGSTDTLKFQVYTTRDFTGDSGGSGDKGGLNDFTDTIGDDWLCSDYWNDYNNIAANGVFRACVGKMTTNNVWNSRGQHAKLAMVAHGNQAVEPGNAIQSLVNNGAGAGYDRPVQIHNIYTNCPLNLHITPTLAMALQWAEVGTDKMWYSGPALNEAIKKGVSSGALSLLGSTFSDHIPKYFPDDFNQDNVSLATAVLDDIYGGGDEVVSRKVLWSPERVVDADWLARMGNLGFEATLVDQTPHLLDWFGRQTALGNDAYKIQRFWLEPSPGQWKSVDAFALSSAASGFRYVNTDGGLSEDLRHLFLRRARTGVPAISSIFYMWEDFASGGNADAYDRSLRWIANHPWIQVVTLDAALGDEVLAGNVAGHNLAATDGMAMQDWVHHACNGNYDNWYYGSDRHESLADKKFEVRQGQTIATAYGDRNGGILQKAWATVKGIRNPQLRVLAEATIFASAFETAFHSEDNGNLTRWSYGEYMYPATGLHWNDELQQWEKMGLMGMAWRAQSRTRLAAVYAAVDDWAGRNTGLEAFARDVDLDGGDEWILRNNSVMAVFEEEGGVMVGAWYKEGTNVWQMVGNFAAQPETGYETQSAGADSTRGTAMKDIVVGDGSMADAAYGVTAGSGMLTFKAGSVTKTVKLADASSAAFEVNYSASGKKLTVRNGLSPDLATLMVDGQARLGETGDGNALVLSTTSRDAVLSATVRVTTGQIDGGATDQPKDSGWNTVNLRNAPQVRQVDVTGTGSLAYRIEFGKEQTSRNPPTMKVTPEGEQTFPVGKASSFRVTATDWQGNALPVEARLPKAASDYSGVPTWNQGSGVLSWSVGAIDPTGMRMADWRTNATFRAQDGYGESVEETVDIVVPWDADGSEPRIGDDWEYLAKKNAKQRQLDNGYDGDPDGDADDDGFSNYSEWVAGTDPADDSEYIAWERQVVAEDEATGKTMVSLEFRSVEGALYHIEQTDTHGLLEGGTNWQWQASVTGAVGQATTWWTGERPAGESRMYRIRVPFRER